MSSCTPEAVKLDAWVNPVCRRSNIDTYYVRLSILRALRQALPDLSGTVLDCGCGISPYKPVLLSKPSAVTAYIGLDLKSEIKLASYTQRPDLEWDGTTIPLPAESVGSAIATEVLEHCKDPTHILSELQRVLKPEGAVFLTVPFLWPLHNNPYDEYRYTPFALERHLREAGFERIRIGALGGWDAALAAMLGLWVIRRDMPELIRRVLSWAALPVYRMLIRVDRPPTDFSFPCMITGLWATAVKPSYKATGHR
jgi:SAM-dependent methyltransferase